LSISLLDLLAEGAEDRLDRLLPRIGGRALAQAAEVAIGQEFGRAFPGKGGEYLGRLIEALDTPLPRVLVTAWRSCDSILALAAGEGRPGGSRSVPLAHSQVKGHWELAPRLADRTLAGPRLLVDLVLDSHAVEVVVRDGRIVGVLPFSILVKGSVAFKGAPEKLFDVGPFSRTMSPAALDFGDGFPIRV